MEGLQHLIYASGEHLNTVGVTMIHDTWWYVIWRLCSQWSCCFYIDETTQQQWKLWKKNLFYSYFRSRPERFVWGRWGRWERWLLTGWPRFLINLTVVTVVIYTQSRIVEGGSNPCVCLANFLLYWQYWHPKLGVVNSLFHNVLKNLRFSAGMRPFWVTFLCREILVLAFSRVAHEMGEERSEGPPTSRSQAPEEPLDF